MKGYITMTGDTPHTGHFELLKACKLNCDCLIVGITSDEVAVVQKRKPVMPFSARKACFEHCKYVDIVIPHKGEPKSIACNRLQVDICFTTEEYVDSPEFDELRNNAPQVKIIAFPRMFDYVSSTDLWAAHRDYTLRKLEVFKRGVAGPLLRFENFIFKVIVCAEQDGSHYEDGFGFFKFKTMPRNHGYLGEPDIFPCISGINPNREIYLHSFFDGRPWSLAVPSLSQIPVSTPLRSPLLTPLPTTIEDFAKHVKLHRDQSVKTTILVSQYGGDMLYDCLLNKPADFCLSVIKCVCSWTVQWQELGVLHNDLHTRNIVVSEDGAVGVIDWGWASGHMFNLCSEERSWLSEQLQNHADWNMLSQSIDYVLLQNNISWRDEFVQLCQTTFAKMIG